MAQVLTTPFWVVKTRLALYRQQREIPRGLVLYSVVKDMLLNEGPTSFFKGLGPSLILSTYGII